MPLQLLYEENHQIELPRSNSNGFSLYLSSRHSVTFKPRSSDALAVANASAMHSKTPKMEKILLSLPIEY